MSNVFSGLYEYSIGIMKAFRQLCYSLILKLLFMVFYLICWIPKITILFFGKIDTVCIDSLAG